MSTQVLLGQLLIGLINGAFYAILSLGLAIIFGLLNIVNFAHGAQYMLGAFVAWMGLNYLGINYWAALLLAPLVVGALGVLVERLLLSRLYKLDPLYGLLLTFGLALIFEGVFRHQYGVSGQQYPVPAALSGGRNLGFMFLPNYRAWVIVAALAVCFFTWKRYMSCTSRPFSRSLPLRMTASLMVMERRCCVTAAASSVPVASMAFR